MGKSKGKSVKKKKIYFMGGMPRSGSTLLTVLLNQHPDIYASHATELLSSMYSYKQSLADYEPVKLNLLTDNYNSVYKNMPFHFYENVEKPIVIDKNRRWGTPFSIDVARGFTEDVKIIYPYRPVLEVLASFVRLTNKNPGLNFIDREIFHSDFLPKYYRPIDDVRCEWLMQPNSMINSSLLALGMALKDENKHMFHIVDYDDLVNDTQDSLSAIYDFLEVDRYEHDFSSLSEYSNVLDGEVLGSPDLHKVRQIIAKESVPPEEVLSDYIIEKYKNTTTSMGMKK